MPTTAVHINQSSFRLEVEACIDSAGCCYLRAEPDLKRGIAASRHTLHFLQRCYLMVLFHGELGHGRGSGDDAYVILLVIPSLASRAFRVDLCDVSASRREGTCFRKVKLRLPR